ncbi:hypothetical protein ACLOJK_006846, partial [Asimina triloba]
SMYMDVYDDEYRCRVGRVDGPAGSMHWIWGGRLCSDGRDTRTEDGFHLRLGIQAKGAGRHPVAGTAAGGATMAGRRHQDGTRPAMGPTTQRRTVSPTQILSKISAAPPL